jgi:hypothetical protein
MPLRKYYNLLGLPNHTGIEQVRKQFRRLAMQYHPDKNPSREASELFIQLTEAYEILIGRKEAPKSALKTPEGRKATQEERIREARKRYMEQQERERIANERYFQQLFIGVKWKIMRLSAIVGLILSALLLVEMILPKHYYRDEITHYYDGKDEYLGKSNEMILKTKRHDEIHLRNPDYTLLGDYTSVYIAYSWLFHLPEQLISVRETEYVYHDITVSFHQLRFLLIALFLLPLVVVKCKFQSPAYTMIYLISLYTVAPILLFFLVSSEHWAHLVTLGFL